MTDYQKIPFTTVNNYLSSFLEAQGVMDEFVTINNKREPTIKPGGQDPKLMDAILDGPDRAPAFIVYSLILDQHDNRPYSDCERMEYSIYAPTAAKVMQVVNVIRDLFGHVDMSAKLVNDYAQAKDKKYFHFFDFEYEMVGGPIGVKSDAGRYLAIVNIHYSYNVSQHNSGLRDSTHFPA